jgi:long-chain acyl-CoA synthetase
VDVADGVTEMPVGQPGELCIRAPEVMQGYWNRPEETRATLRDGWLHTGDIARVDEDGYFFIVDRKKDMIISGGYNIYPRDVEDVLYMHPKVKEAAVAGIPDPKWGETVTAFLVLKDGEHATADEVKAFCRERLASYKVPSAIEFREALPKTLVGKVLRRVLTEEAKKKANV